MKVINDLYDYENLKIVQENESFKFSLDSLLLAEFVDSVDNSKKVLDLCTGNGVIPFVLSYYYKNAVVGFEIQKDIYNLALEGVQLNGLENQITLYHDNVINIGKYFPGNNFDIITVNPPYFKYNKTSLINQNEQKAIARHEIFLSLEELFQVVKYALKENGIFYLVHLPERLEEILALCEKYKLVAKKIQFVYTKEDYNASIVLIKCVHYAKNSLVVSPPLFIQNYKSYKNIFRK